MTRNISIGLDHYLASYLTDEGFSQQLLEEHKSRLPLPTFWFLFLWLAVVVIVWLEQGSGGLLAGIVTPLLLLIASFIPFVLFYVFRNRSGKGSAYDINPNIFGAFFLIIYPVLLAVFLGIYLRSWGPVLKFLFIAIIGLFLIVILQHQRYRVRLLLELLRSPIRAFRQSVALLVVLIPVLLVVVLLSVFSSELWESIGNLAWPRLLLGAFFLTIPAILLLFTRMEPEANRMVPQNPDVNQLISMSGAIPYIQEKREQGFISQEEWTDAVEQMKWRNTDKLLNDIVPSLRRWVKVWFALLLMTTSILLIVVFLVYFFIVFRTFLDARIVSEWVNISYESSTIQWQDFGLPLQFEIDTVFLPTIKVSFILAIFVAVMSIVYALTEDSFKEQLTEWLSNRAEQWLAASSMYLSITRPDYQIWDLTVDDKRSGRVNVSIVIPRDLPDDAVRRACEHLDSRLEEYRKLVVITAFEQRSHDQRYRLGIPSKRWQYINNKSTKKIYFQDNSLVADEIRYQDYLGQDVLQNGESIPHEWFGNTLEAVSFARSIWESDPSQDLILHPYSFEVDQTVTLEVHILKRLPNSKSYRDLIKNLLPKLLDVFQSPPKRLILVDVSYRDTVDSLAHFHWFQEYGYIDYKDEFMNNKKAEKPEMWGLKE